jgi:hypothetical protein
MIFVHFVAHGRKPKYGGELRASKKFVGIFVGIESHVLVS